MLRVADLNLALPSSNARKLAWAGAAAAVAAAVFAVVSTLIWVVRAYSPLPFWDQWETVTELGKLYDGGFAFSDLVLQHNEHRLVFPRLVFYADALLFGGRNLFSQTAVLGVQAVHAALLISLLGALKRPAAVAAAALVVALLLFAGQWENLVWGFQIQFVGVLLLTTLGYLSLARAADAAGRARILWFAGAALCCFVGVYSMASGMAALGVAAAVSLALRAPRWMTVALAVELVVCGALYFRGYHAIPGNSTAGYALAHPLACFAYLAAYVGNIAGLVADRPPGAALSALLHPAPVLLGVAGLGLAATALLREARRRFEARVEVVLLGVMTYVLAGAALTAMGRLQLGLDQAHASRYQTPGAIFWAVQAVYWTRASLSWTPAPKAVVAAGVAGLFGLIVWSQTHLWPQIEAHGVSVRIAADALRSQVRDNSALGAAYPRPGEAWDRAQVLKAHRLSIYGEDATGWLGLPMTQIALPSGDCTGAFDIVNVPMSNAASEGQVAGWAWDAKHRRRPERILLTNQAGVVVGFASLGVRRPDVAAALRWPGAALSGWTGFARLDGAPVHALALLDDGTACEVGVKAAPLRGQ